MDFLRIRMSSKNDADCSTDHTKQFRPAGVADMSTAMQGILRRTCSMAMLVLLHALPIIDA